VEADVNLKPYEEILEEMGPLEPDDIFRVLGRVQEAYGYIPRPVLEDLGERLGRPVAELYGAVSFYPGFRLSPVGEEE